jgi:hypothetical protein
MDIPVTDSTVSVHRGICESFPKKQLFRKGRLLADVSLAEPEPAYKLLNRRQR